LHGVVFAILSLTSADRPWRIGDSRDVPVEALRCVRDARTGDERSSFFRRSTHVLRRISLRRCNELRGRNENPSFRISALHPALGTSRESHSEIFCNRKTIVGQIPAMTPVLSKTENGKQHAQ
jgi:hypothetical protein